MRWRREVDPRVAEVLAGASGERLLAWGELVDGQVVVCTDLAIHMPEDGRVPWDLVVRGAWSEEFLDLVVQAAPGAASRQLRLRFDEPGQVPSVVQGTRAVDRGRLAPGGARPSRRPHRVGDAQRPPVAGDR